VLFSRLLAAGHDEAYAGALSEAAMAFHGMRELLASLGRQCPHDGNVWQKILWQSMTVL
jgi:hypothetical protein